LWNSPRFYASRWAGLLLLGAHGNGSDYVAHNHIIINDNNVDGGEDDDNNNDIIIIISQRLFRVE